MLGCAAQIPPQPYRITLDVEKCLTHAHTHSPEWKNPTPDCEYINAWYPHSNLEQL